MSGPPIVDDRDLQDILLACGRGELAANVALARMIMRAASPGCIDHALAGAARCAHDAPAATRIRAARDLWSTSPAAWQTVKGVIAAADHATPATSPARWAEAFDRAAAVSPAAAAAAYALGREDLLADATAELVDRLSGWGLLAPEARVLDLGCGAGRLTAALAPHVTEVIGLDISRAMLEAARQRCASARNVQLVETDGMDLAPLVAHCATLVVAVDVFPYLVACEPPLAVTHFAACRRVLAPGGALAIFNYSYRGHHDADAADVAAQAAAHGFHVVRVSRGDFRYWDATTFLLERELEWPCRAHS